MNDFTFVSFNDNLIEVVKLTTGVYYTLGNRIYGLYRYFWRSVSTHTRKCENKRFNRFSVCIFAAQ